MENYKLIAYTDPKSPISEAYRTLRTNIQFSSLDNPIRTIIVTSSGPGEGKTTTTINLAIAMAQSGSKVLLIDGDLRKPKLHKIFKTSNQVGLTNILVNELDYKEGVYSSHIEKLDILPAGVIPPNPSELLASNKMKQFLNNVKKDYDYIMVDTPPVAVVTDASILSTIVDGTLLVCASGQVPIEVATRAKALLENVKANIIGVVLNKIPINERNYSQYYYYSYYAEDESTTNKKRNKKRNKKKNKRVKANG
ncbi:CpsD/CapB family tyrosine-protein kinase [Alkaliphilus sp. B6464]|uniref:CpsD/CapB family tyrosine-protein kinase n=1 Tax=Alkaliphilus sp. B6464 TaxID=2731219 RepID=UPI001BA6FBE9|nr:CpsD/CapB family tyrosine-protein kinase [Alkaliphilus sp. B6464]QUH19076.1 CpsD/CapB family tyrosine-protein kinase [Alkaliphilus sp. B6464]